MMQREAMMTKEFESGAVIAWGIVLEGKVRGPLTTLRSVAEGWKAYGYEVVGLRAVSAVAAEALRTSQPAATSVDAQVELTDEQIGDVIANLNKSTVAGVKGWGYREFARAILAATKAPK
jgi:hypothetical protein